MSGFFIKGQVVRARRTEVDRYQPGWYLHPLPENDMHLIHIKNQGPAEIHADNIQCVDPDINLDVQILVFIDSQGRKSVAVDNGDDFIEEAFNEFMGKTLIGRIDLSPFDITFPEGAGLLPKKYRPDAETRKRVTTGWA